VSRASAILLTLALAATFVSDRDAAAGPKRPIRLKSRAPKARAPITKYELTRRTSPLRPARPRLAELRFIDVARVERSRGLSLERATKVVLLARQKLGVDFRIDWQSSATSMWHHEGRPITVPGAMLRTRALTADGLALMLAHEAAHARGIKDEASADFWAARRGLRKLLGAKYARKRALEAAYSALKSQAVGDFDTANVSRELHINGSGYPTPQSRWNLYVSGIYAREMPAVTRRDQAGEPTFVTEEQAALLLGVSQAWLAQRATQPGGPATMHTSEGLRYVVEDLEHFRSTHPIAN